MNTSIEQDLPEYYKRMGDFLKHLSILSITMLILSAGLLTNIFPDNDLKGYINFAILALGFSSLFSVLGTISYVEVFLHPEKLTGSKFYKLVTSTAIPITLFFFGASSICLYIIFGVVGI